MSESGNTGGPEVLDIRQSAKKFLHLPFCCVKADFGKCRPVRRCAWTHCYISSISSWRFPAIASTCCCWLLRLRWSIMIIGVHGSVISAVPSAPCSAPLPLKHNRSPAQFHHRRRIAAKRVFMFQTGGLKWREFGCRLVTISPPENRKQMLQIPVILQVVFAWVMCLFQVVSPKRGLFQEETWRPISINWIYPLDTFLIHCWLNRFGFQASDAKAFLLSPGLLPGHAWSMVLARVRTGPAAVPKPPESFTRVPRTERASLSCCCSFISSSLLSPSTGWSMGIWLWGGICGGLLR